MWRNNNPGNLRGSNAAIGKDKDNFAIFPDMETGKQAQHDLLRNKKEYKDNTIKDMIHIYAPAKDGNDVPKYIKDIGDFSGLDVNRKISDLNTEEYDLLLDAIRRKEGAIDKNGNPIGVGVSVPGLSTLRPEPRPQAEAEQPQPTSIQNNSAKQGADASGVLQGGAGSDTLAGGGGTDSPASPAPQSGLVEVKKEPPVDPEIIAMTGMSGSPVTHPGRAALLKPVEKLTQPEMMDMLASAQGDYRGWRAGDPMKAHTYERVQDWHVAMYGDGPQATDGGKPVEPQPIRPIPEMPSPHTTPQGEDLWQATGRMGQKVADAAQGDGIANAVKSLQRGLNILNQANPLPDRSPAYGPATKLGPVAEDGAYGPQTDFALKHATARLGPAKVEDSFALGRFNTFAREAQKSGNADGLEAATHGAFGPLFQTPKIEAGVLQETLNDMGSQAHDDWEPLKVDNWIGPKTTAAFGKVLKSEDADSVTTAFGRGLGLL